MSNFSTYDEEARIMIPHIRRDAEAFKTASQNLKSNRSFIEAYPLAFKYSSDALKGDKELVLAAIKERPENFQFAQASLRHSKTFLREALHVNPFIFRFLDGRSQEDEELASLAMKLHLPPKFIPSIFRSDLSFMRSFLSTLHSKDPKDHVLQMVESTEETLRQNKEFMLECVQKNGFSLKFASKDLQNDETIVFAAIKNEPKSLLFASLRFRENEALVRKCIEHSPDALKYVSPRFLKNRKIVVISLQRNGCLLKYIPEPLRSDARVIDAAVTQSREAWSFVPERKLDDEDFVISVAEKFEEIFERMSKRLKGNELFVLKNIGRYPNILRNIPVELRRNESFLEEVYRIYPLILKTHANVFVESRNFVLMILPPSLATLQKNFEKLFRSEFPKDDIYFSYNLQRQSSECVVQYGKNENLPVRQCLACTLYLKEKKMAIDYLKVTEDKNTKCNCEYSGTDLLIKLYRIAKTVKLKEITLMDASKKYFRNTDCSVDFQTWNVLTTSGSLSWYESFGYRSSSKKKEKVIKSLQVSVFTLMQKLDKEKAEHVKEYAKKIGIQITAETTLQQLGFLVKQKMNEGKINCLEESGEKFLKVFLSFIPRPYGMYEVFSLKTNDVNTIQFYKDLEKKFSKTIVSVSKHEPKNVESKSTRKKQHEKSVKN